MLVLRCVCFRRDFSSFQLLATVAASRHAGTLEELLAPRWFRVIVAFLSSARLGEDICTLTGRRHARPEACLSLSLSSSSFSEVQMPAGQGGLLLRVLFLLSCALTTARRRGPGLS